MARPTLKDIAKRLDVSIGTVHRVIYDKPGVGDELRGRILKEVEALGFKVDVAASVLRRSEVNIAVVLPSALNENRYFFGSLWDGVREVAAELKRSKVNVCSIITENDIVEQNRALARLYDDRSIEIHGLMTLAVDQRKVVEWIDRFANRGIPVVLVNTDAEESRRVSCVAAPQRQSGRLAAEALLKCLPGRTGSIALLSGDEHVRSHQMAVSGFAEYVAERSTDHRIIDIKGFGEHRIRNDFSDLLAECGDLVGVYSCNARNTFAACSVLGNAAKAAKPVLIGTDVFKELIPYFQDDTLTASIYQYPKLQASKAVQILYEHIAFNTACSPVEYVPLGLVMKGNYEYYL